MGLFQYRKCHTPAPFIVRRVMLVANRERIHRQSSAEMCKCGGGRRYLRVEADVGDGGGLVEGLVP